MSKTNGTRIDELVDALADVIAQACGQPDSRVDSLGLTAYANAIRLLEHYGRVEIESIQGRRVIAQFVNGIPTRPT